MLFFSGTILDIIGSDLPEGIRQFTSGLPFWIVLYKRVMVTGTKMKSRFVRTVAAVLLLLGPGSSMATAQSSTPDAAPDSACKSDAIYFCV